MKTAKKLLSAGLLGIVGALVAPGVGLFLAVFMVLFGGGAAGGNLFFFDGTGLSLPVEGVKAVSELIYSSKFESPKWTDFMDIEPGIKSDKQIVITGHFNGLAGAVKSNCDTTPNPDTIGGTEKTWQPRYISDRFEECFDTLQTTFFKWMLANGINKEDLTQSDYEAFVLKLIEEYMGDDMMYRLLFFTDTGIAAGGTNNLGAGQLKYFNMLDGIFKQLETIITVDADRRITITENAQASYVLQRFATASPTVHPATDYLDAVVYGATMELRGVADPIILVTQSVADQYARERKAVTNIELAYTRTETGLNTFQYNGIDVIPIYTWDRLIQRHFDNGTKFNNPHRILYTSKTNIRVGVEQTKDLAMLNAKYNDYHKKFFVDFGFNLDVKIIEDKKVQYAY